MWLSALLAAAAATSFSRMQARPVVDADVVSAAGAPRRNFLDEPCIAVGIGEGEERSIARALGIRSGNPRLLRERCAVPHVTCTDATAGDFLVGCFDIGDNQRPHGGTRRRRG